MILDILTTEQKNGIKEDILTKMHFNKLCGFLLAKGITPNILTSFNFLIALTALWFLFKHPYLYVMFLLLNYFIDIIDGYYARHFLLSSRRGEILDHGSDVLVGLLFLIKSYFYFHMQWILIIIFMVIVQLIILYKYKLLSQHFPSRSYLLISLTGFYKEALIIQFFYQPLTFFYWIYGKRLNILLERPSRAPKYFITRWSRRPTPINVKKSTIFSFTKNEVTTNEPTAQST